MSFQYKARDPLGNLHQGTIDTDDAEDAKQQLRRDGFQVVAVEEADQDGLALLAPRVSKSDIIYATSQLAIMVDTGITLAAALDGICRQEENPTLKEMLAEIKSEVESGGDFSDALAKYPRHFDTTYVALVRASEQTGTLAQMLDRIADYLRRELESRGKVRAAMAYPTVMFVLAVGVTIFMLTFVLPKFEPLFTSRGTDLPTITKVMVASSNAMIEHWYAWLGGAVALVAGFLYGRRTQKGRMALDWMKLNAPIMGPMFRKVSISRSVHTLGTMLQSGVSMLEALELSAEVAGNCHYREVWYRVRDEVTTGNRVCDALAGNTLFPSTLVQMMAAGEETGKLDAVLVKVSTYYDGEVERALKTATSMIEPIMITVMGVVVGGIAMGLLLPIFSLSRPG